MSRKTIIKSVALIILTIMIVSIVLPLSDAEAATRVRGYYRKDGTYVRPHYRSSPDSNPYNNWSYPGNTNPYTGKVAPGNPDTYLDNYCKKASPSNRYCTGRKPVSLPSPSISIPSPSSKPQSPSPVVINPIVSGTFIPKKHPNGTVVLGNDNRTVYLIEDGVRKGFATPQEFESHGYSLKDIVSANKKDLDVSVAANVPFADGTLVLDKSTGGTIYMIHEGTRRGFTSAEVFNQLGYNFNQAVSGNLRWYTEGTPISSGTQTHPPGALVKVPDGDGIYLITETGKKLVPNMKVFNSWNWDLDNVVLANPADLALNLEDDVKFRDGTIIRFATGAIYVISDGAMRYIPSMDTFSSLGYKIANTVDVALSDISGYPHGQSL